MLPEMIVVFNYLTLITIRNKSIVRLVKCSEHNTIIYVVFVNTVVAKFNSLLWERFLFVVYSVKIWSSVQSGFLSLEISEQAESTDQWCH